MSASYQLLQDIIPLIVHPTHGIVQYVEELPRQGYFADFFYYKAVLANTGVFGNEESHPTAGGVAVDRDRALAKAIGESIERYASAIYFRDELLWGDYKNLSSEAIHPDQFQLFKEEQFNTHNPCEKFDENSKVYWSNTTNLYNEKSYLVPSSLVYCPYQNDSKRKEKQYFETISTGLSAHVTLTKASINGILEVVERDAFMSFWLLQLELPQINLKSLIPSHHTAISRLNKAGYEVDIRVFISDANIPTIVSQLIGRGKSTVRHVIAAATCLNPSDAVQKSLEELSLMERFIQGRKHSGQVSSGVNSLHDHVLYWLNENHILPKFLSAKTGTVNLDKLPLYKTEKDSNDLKNLVETIVNSGYQVYISDITLEDIESLGMKVVRAIIPGYLPLNKRAACRPFGAPRLANEIARWNLTEKDINYLPHPFA